MTRCAVVGAGGAIGGWLCRRLLAEGHQVVASDIKGDRDWWQWHSKAKNLLLDVRDPVMADQAVKDCDWVFNLAADMGGLDHLVGNDAEVVHNNLLISIHVLEAARKVGARYLETSSACIYPEGLQTEADIAGLRESDAYPAMPDMGYGWAKLMGERMALYHAGECNMEVRLPRLHNVYGPMGAWTGGREKSPASLARKIATAKLTKDHRVTIYGDGNQTRSYCFVEDCVEGLIRLMTSGYDQPLNLGSDRMVTINQLAEILADIADIAIDPIYDLTAPQGVRGRNSDNTLIRQVLGWEPSTPLEDGLFRLYHWVKPLVEGSLRGS